MRFVRYVQTRLPAIVRRKNYSIQNLEATWRKPSQKKKRNTSLRSPGRERNGERYQAMTFKGAPLLMINDNRDDDSRKSVRTLRLVRFYNAGTRSRARTALPTPQAGIPNRRLNLFNAYLQSLRTSESSRASPRS